MAFIMDSEEKKPFVPRPRRSFARRSFGPRRPYQKKETSSSPTTGTINNPVTRAGNSFSYNDFKNSDNAKEQKPSFDQGQGRHTENQKFSPRPRRDFKSANFNNRPARSASENTRTNIYKTGPHKSWHKHSNNELPALNSTRDLNPEDISAPALVPVQSKRKAPRYKDRREDLSASRKLPPILRPHKEVKGEELGKDTLKIIPLGGLGEVGRNSCVIEYKNDIIIIDIGIGFPEDDMPGIDYCIPNFSYLEGKEKNIRGVIFTHGHMDHIGGLPYVLQKLGNPPIYTMKLTHGIIAKRHIEFPFLPELDVTVVEKGESVMMGDIRVEFFHVNHTIPDDTAIIIETPAGRIVHTADFKFDETPLNEEPADLEFIKSIGDRPGGVSVLMSDSTGAEKAGKTLSEQVIQDNLEIIFKESKGMIIVGTFSSLINRIQQMIVLAEKYGRKVALDGFSLKSNIEFAKETGQIRAQKDTLIPIDAIDDYPRSKVMIIGTGAQGEGRAVLMRVASGEHRHIKLLKGDSVVFSSSVIPGNERTVQRLKDLFYRMGARVFHYGMMDIHASGHAQQDDLRQMIRLIRPKFLMPIHGQYSMMVNHGYLGEAEGIPEDNIIIADNGQIIHIHDDGKKADWLIDKKQVNADIVMIDGLGVGDIRSVVLRDRQVLAEDGMFVVVAVVDSKTGRVLGSPDIISRGFIYLKESRELLISVRRKVKILVEKKFTRPINWAYLKDAIRDDIGLFLFQKTERRPMVLPVIIEV